MLKSLFLAGVVIVSVTASAQAQNNWLAYGKSLVSANCAVCHAIGLADKSQHAEAPPFRELLERYPVDALEESFVEGISTGHPDMPEFIATPEQIAAIIDYISSLELR